MPDQTVIGKIEALEKAFNQPVDEFLDYKIPNKNSCLCPVDLECYLNAAGATWQFSEEMPGDFEVAKMPVKSISTTP